MARVLVVDDDADIRNVLAGFLGNEGHEVIEAGSAAAAWDALASSPELILLDVDMPGETGVEFVMRLRKHETSGKTPVIFVTAYPERSTALQLTREGAHSVVSKPFHREDILRAVREIVA